MTKHQPRWRALGEHLAEEQDAFLARHPVRTAFRATRRRKPRRAWWLAAAAALVSLGLLTARAAHRTPPLGLSVAGKPGRGQWITAPSETPVPLRFSDGSEVTLAPYGRARVLDVTASGAHVMLESGTARVSVTPNRDERWTFSAGPFTVDVRGTRFDIEWSPQEERFELTLIEGKVTVSGCALGDARPVLAGETVIASCRTNDFQIGRSPLRDALAVVPAPSTTSAEPPPAPPPVPSGDVTTVSPAAPSAAQPGAAVESWQTLARASKFREAFARANERGFDLELRRDDVDDLLLLGDVARLSGDASQAARAYQRLRERAPGTEAAANAAFSMGRVSFDQRVAYGEAARWFATYLSERQDGPLAREALGRQMEALSRAGDRAGAGRVAEQYLGQYPEGPHASLARTLREPR
jgi:transmembrane sensor